MCFCYSIFDDFVIQSNDKLVLRTSGCDKILFEEFASISIEMDASYGRERDRFNASHHYVWRQGPGDILGEGSFGTVYRGLHKVI